MADNAATPIPLWQPIFNVILLGVLSATFMWESGDRRWIEGWLFVGLFFFVSLAASMRMYFRDPGLFKERFSSPIQPEQRPWDKIVIVLLAIAWVLWFFGMPLDARRFGWSPQLPVWLEAAGFVLTALGYLLFYETFRENTFAAPVVKMQEGRRQTVISTGLYSIVRHPLYASASLMMIGSPILLSSLYGLIPGVALVIIFAVRSVGEENMLRTELDGYEAYTRRVRWRLVPYVF